MALAEAVEIGIFEHALLEEHDDGGAHVEDADFISGLHGDRGVVALIAHPAFALAVGAVEVFVEAHLHVADVGGGDHDEGGFPLRSLEDHDDPFVDPEEIRDRLHAPGVHGPEEARDVAAEDDLAINRGMDAVVVRGAEIVCEKTSSVEGIVEAFAPEEFGNRVGLSLRLNQRIVADRAGFGDEGVGRMDDSLIDGARAGFQAPREELPDRFVVVDGVLGLLHIDLVVLGEPFDALSADNGRKRFMNQAPDPMAEFVLRKKRHDDVKDAIFHGFHRIADALISQRSSPLASFH